MRTKILKLVSIAALLFVAAFWKSAPNYQFALNLVVCLAAAVVAVQAARAKRYVWAVGFGAIAFLFNPALPPIRLVGPLSLFLVLISIAAFAASLAMLKTQSLLSIASITDRTPGSRSL